MEKEETLKMLREIKTKAEGDLKDNHVGYEKCVVENVIHYKEKVELINRKTKQKEKFDLCVVTVRDPDSQRIKKMCYLNGEEADFINLMIKYESPEPIKDVINPTKEDKEKYEKEKTKTEDLQALEKEEKKTENKKEDENKKTLQGLKPKNVLQTVKVKTAYIDNWTTVSRGFDLPPQVEGLAISRPEKNDSNPLSQELTIYMLDAQGNIIENANGKNINDFFKVDDATGKNPRYDDNTKLELGGYAEKNIGQTMRRFKSKESKDLYFSVEQKEIGSYHELYVGGKTFDGNDPVEVQLETKNVGVQTNLEMQEIISNRKGIYHKDEMDQEADTHAEHGDDEEKIPIEYADGDIKNVVFKCKYIPGVDKTWDELSEETGESITKLQERFGKELADGKKPDEILSEIEYDYEMIGHEQEHKFF